MSNTAAFLTMIAVSEGTQPIGDRGYNCIVGSTVARPVLFSSYADHPRRLVDLGRGLKSTAAGRYQILQHNFDAYKATLKLPDFGPLSQDRIALQMIMECKALQDVLLGDLAAAVAKCASRWASLPGASYGQRENTLVVLRAAYVGGGGTACS